MKLAVIGIGGSGSAALRFLAQAGHEVTGFEQFQTGHDRGSSHGHSRIIRKSYPDPFHTRMMSRSYALWNELEREAGEQLFVRCGGITFGPAGDPKVESTKQSLDEAGLAYEVLSHAECAARFPAIDIGKGSHAIYQAESGFLRATRCVHAQVRLARQHGALLQEQCPVLHLQETESAVLVSTASRTESFDAIIVTAGPWIGKLLAPLKLPLRTALRQVIYTGIARNAGHFQPDKLPVWIEEPEEYYGFPADGEVEGIKFASHDAGIDFDPDHLQRPVMEAQLRQALEHIARRFPDVTGELLCAQTCLYTITPDERFILDFAPGSKRIVACSGCSGHGFKFTVLLGHMAAGMAVSGKPDPHATPWRLDRF